MAIDSDSIEFDRDKVEELSQNYNKVSVMLKSLIESTDNSVNIIKKNWVEGPERDKAELDFQNAAKAIVGLKNNLTSMGNVLSDTASGFESARY